MENAEEVMQILERFTRLKQKEIPKELDEYLQYVAKTGDTVFKWTNLKYLFREKLLNVITHFHDTTPRMDEIPQYPNVDPFNYESMKSSLLERLESFNAAPFTIQRLSELLIDPRKQYNRIDKFMRALEKNILVVSTVEPGRKRTESENGDSLDSVVNGDLSLDVNVDIDMDNEPLFNIEAQNGNANGNEASPTEAEASNEAESKPADETGEPTAAVATTKANAAHEPPLRVDDEDLQPSPKKAKLDVDDDAEPSGVAAATIEIENAVKLVEKIAESNVIIEEKKQESENNEAEEKKEKLDVESDVKIDTKPAETAESKTVAAETPEKESSEMTTDVKQQSSEVEAKAKNVPAEVKESAAEKVDSATEQIVKVAKTEVDASPTIDKLEDVASALEQADNKEAEEKIVEKQEIEKCEKDEKIADVEESAQKVTVETTTTTTSKAAVDEKEAEKIDEPKSETVESSEAATTAQDKEKPEKDQKAEPSTTNAGAEADSTATPLKTEGTAAETVVVGASKDETTSEAEASADAEATVATEGGNVETATITSTSNTDITTATPEAAPIVAKTIAAKTDDAAAVAGTSAETTAHVTETIAETTTTVPALALNDQPMEEDATIAAAAAATTAIVDEVIMAESTTTAAGVSVVAGENIEMAMDETTTSKADEPGDTMDVDDTSQQEEAMDQ